MANDGLISVIIPVYNVEAYLRECVDSVLNQSYQKFEIILVDDGSKDSSGAICDEYAEKEPRIRVIHKENGGASSARNAGLYTAKGEFVFFLDSDDWLDSCTLQKLYDAVSKDNADFSFCEAYAVDDSTGEMKTANYQYHKAYGTGDPQQFMAEMLKYKEFHVAVWMLLFRRSYLQDHDLRFVEGIMYEDAIFTYQVYALAKCAVHVHEYLYYRRYHSNSVMTAHKSARNFVSAVRAYHEVTDFWRQNQSRDEVKPFLVRTAYNAVTDYRALGKKERSLYRAEFHKLKDDILENNAYGDTGLKSNCYGKLFWYQYKIAGKLFHK